LLVALTGQPGVGSLWALIFVLPAFVVLVGVWHGPWRQAVVVATSAVLVITPVANHYGALVADSLVWQGWTPVKQRVMNLAGVDNCGLLDDVELVTDAFAVGEGSTQASREISGPFGLSAYALSSPNESVSFRFEDGSTPEVLWVRGIDGVADLIIELTDSEGERELLFSDRSQRDSERSHVWVVDGDYWTIVILPTRKEWQEVAIRGVPTGFGVVNLAVSHPASASWQNPIDAVSGTTLLAGPGMSPYVSCANEPRKKDGRWVDIDYVLVTNHGKPLGYERVGGQQAEIGFRPGRDSWVSILEVRP
jgi:hypothetical protein